MYTTRLQRLCDPHQLLLWHCGRDLAAALEPQFLRPASNPADFVKCLAAWVSDHPDQALQLLPEWQALLTLLQG